jgi:tRNA G26 N,N-dimethylase Trm1
MVLVFRTSVSSKQKIRQLKSVFEQRFAVIKWNFDLEDCDKILRIETNENISLKVVSTLQNMGFECSELH